MQAGQQVTAKEVIGWSGGAQDDPHSGNSTGPHLHFELRQTAGGVPGYSGAVDPLPLLRSHDYNPDAKPLYQVQVVVNELNIRTRPDTKSQVVTVVGRGCEFSVLAEVECGDMLWLRLHSPLTRYLCARQGQQTYARRLLSYTSRPETVPWADSVTAFLRSLGYTGPEPQNER